MAGTLPPIFVIGDGDHGGYVAVALYTPLSLMVVTVVTRFFSRWYIGRVVHSDDIWLGAAALLAIIQSVFVELAIDHGLGKKVKTVSSADFQSFQQYEYAAQILLIATIACSKTSHALLFKNLMTTGIWFRANQILIGLIAGWAAASIFALAFQCSMPHPWDWTGRCINQAAFFQSIAALNIITDIALVVFPSFLLWRVQISIWKRSRIMALLGTRILVCLAAGFQAYYTNILVKSTDRTWTNINSSIWDQTMMNLSIITTAIPSLGRLIIELQPDIRAFAYQEQDELHTGNKYGISSGSRFGRDYKMDGRLEFQDSLQVSTGWRPNKDDAESTQGLVKELLEPGWRVKTRV